MAAFARPFLFGAVFIGHFFAMKNHNPCGNAISPDWHRNFWSNSTFEIMNNARRASLAESAAIAFDSENCPIPSRDSLICSTRALLGNVMHLCDRESILSQPSAGRVSESKRGPDSVAHPRAGAIPSKWRGIDWKADCRPHWSGKAPPDGGFDASSGAR